MRARPLEATFFLGLSLFHAGCGDLTGPESRSSDAPRDGGGAVPMSAYPFCIGRAVSCEDSWEYAGRCNRQPGCTLQRISTEVRVLRFCVGEATRCEAIEDEFDCGRAHYCRWVRDACDAPIDVCDAATRLVGHLRGHEASATAGCLSVDDEREAHCILANLDEHGSRGVDTVTGACAQERPSGVRTWLSGDEAKLAVGCGFGGFSREHLAAYDARGQPPYCEPDADPSDDCTARLEHCVGSQASCAYPPPYDGGFRDAGFLATDGGYVDAGTPHPRDAGPRDGGVFVRDAGFSPPRDGGVFVRDAGFAPPRDGGVFVRDAGFSPPRDGGVFVRDAGFAPRDAGPRDAG